MPSKTRWLARAALVLLSTSGGLAICEAVARGMAPPQAGITAAERWDADCIQAKAGPGYGWKPGHCGANSAGFLGAEYPLEKDPEIFRIVLLGDSISGDGRTARWLEEQLRDALQRPVEVLNFGVFGYNPTNELATWQSQAHRYNPDLVIHQFCVNDFQYTPVFFEQDGQLMSVANMNGQMDGLPIGLYQNSALLRWATALATDRAQRRVTPDFAARAPAILDALTTLDAELNAAGVPWVSVLYPYLAEREDWRDEDRLATQTHLERMAELGVPTLDLGEAFQAVGADRLLNRNAQASLEQARAGTLPGLSPAQRAVLLGSANRYFPQVVEEKGRAPDRIHPNAIGHFLASWHIKAFIAPYLPAPKPAHRPVTETKGRRKTRTPADR